MADDAGVGEVNVRVNRGRLPSSAVNPRDRKRCRNFRAQSAA